MRNTGTDRTIKAIDKVLRIRAKEHAGDFRSPAMAAATQALEEIETSHQLGVIERIELRRALLKELTDLVESKASNRFSPPAKAPELWSEREGRKENPVAFIRRVYASWLYRGLTRGDLRSLDLPLYQALAVWLNRHPEEQFPEMKSPFEGIGESVDRAMETYLAKPRGPRRRPKLSHLRSK